MATFTELLAEVDNAIIAVLTKGQEYTIDGRTFKRADLETLKTMRNEYKALADGETNGGRRVRAMTKI